MYITENGEIVVYRTSESNGRQVCIKNSHDQSIVVEDQEVDSLIECLVKLKMQRFLRSQNEDFHNLVRGD